MKKLTKVLSIVMLVAMCVSMFAGSAFADGVNCQCGGVISTTPVPGTPATCTTPGTVEYYKCNNCTRCYADPQGNTWLSTLEIPAAHTLTAVPAKAATCTVAGNSAYWHCTACGKYFSDAAGTAEITDLSSTVIAATNHPNRTSFAALDPTCKNPGNIAYDVCNTCGVKLVGNNIVNYVELAATGNHTWGAWIVDKEATAYDDGQRHRVCTGCGITEYEGVDAEGVSREDAVHVLDHIGSTYWKSGMDPLQFYSNYYDIYAYSGTLKIDGKSIDRESYWANSEGVITLGTNLMSKLSAGKHSIQVVDTTDPRIDSNTLYFTVAATLKATDTDKHVINSSKSLKFVASDEIVSAKVGSIELTDKDDFKINGKYVTLYADFLNDRTAGSTYTLTVTTKGGETASTTFKILTTAQASASPRTGDDSNIALWSALVLMSGAAMIAVLPRLKKEQ